MRSDGVIITPAVIDNGYLDMARNMYLTSIVPHNLTDHTLFLCVDRSACDAARAHGLPTFLFRDNDNHYSGDFDSGVFVEKAKTKLFMIYEILHMGFSVLLSDLDIFWFKNPVDDVIKTCGSCDFAIQAETGVGLNIGFLYVRPTNNSLAFFKFVTKKSASTGQGAQALFNNIIKKYPNESISYKVLDQNVYPDGRTYFEKQNRRIPTIKPDSCPECSICHNNWIVGTEAKTYRFKEHHMWAVDDDGYYSNPDGKYIMYNNPHSRGNSLALEIHTLQGAFAMAQILGRILIVPLVFHNKYNNPTSIIGLLHIRHLDTIFKGAYRESTFLHHPKVPEHVKYSQCGSYLVKTNFSLSYPQTFEEEAMDKVFTPNEIENGATDREIEEWFTGFPYDGCPVIRFHSLYNAFKEFENQTVNDEFTKKFTSAYEPGGFRQLGLLSKKCKKSLF